MAKRYRIQLLDGEVTLMYRLLIGASQAKSVEDWVLAPPRYDLSPEDMLEEVRDFLDRSCCNGGP